MFGFVFGVILFIGIFVVTGFTKSGKGAFDGISWKCNPKQFLSVIGVVVIILGCFKSVPTGHTGIVTTFGRVENYTLDAGIHFMAPWKDVINMDNRTQKQTLTLSCFSSDIQEVSVVYTINYQINKQNAQEIYRSIGTEYFTKIIEPRALETIKGVFAQYNAENLVALRGSLSTQIEEVLLGDLANYNIEIVATSIEDIDFTDAFTEAVEQKQVAEQNKLKAQTEQEQATLEAEAAAERQVIQAQADADAAIIAANNDAEIAKIAADSAEYQGQKDAAIMSNLGQMIQQYPELIQYYYVTGWDGNLPETMLGDDANILYGLGE